MNSLETYLTPKLKLAYTEFQELLPSNIHEKQSDNLNHNYRLLKAKHTATKELHTIRILDNESDLFKKDRNTALSIFIQEIIHITSRAPEQIITEHCEYYDEKIVFVTRLIEPLSVAASKEEQNQILLEAQIEKLIRGVNTDLKFLRTKMKLEGVLTKGLSLQRICCITENQETFLSDWGVTVAQLLQKDFLTNDSSIENHSTAPEAQEIYDLGITILELVGIDDEGRQDLVRIKASKNYNAALDTVMKEVEAKGHTDQFLKLMRRILQIDPNARPTFEEVLADFETHRKENSKQDNAVEEIKVVEEAKPLARVKSIQNSTCGF